MSGAHFRFQARVLETNLCTSLMARNGESVSECRETRTHAHDATWRLRMRVHTFFIPQDNQYQYRPPCSPSGEV